MKNFFRPNIATAGRVLRAFIALALLAAIIFARDLHSVFRLARFAAAFVAFEGLRGWCALRACGIRTKL